MTTKSTQRARRGATLLAGVSGLALLLAAAPAFAGTHIDTGVETVPTDHPSPWNIDGGLEIGDNATAELDVISGGDVVTTNANTCGSIFLGFNASGKGTLKVDGAGSTLNNGSCSLIAGFNGQGVINVSNGGVLTTGLGNNGSFLTSSASATATVTIDGAGSAWNFTGLGTGNGVATLNVTNGGLLNQTNCVNMTIATGSTGKGTINVSGAGSHWGNGGGNCGVYLGGDGEGTINVTGGGLVDGILQVVMGNNAGSKGTLLISGAGSTLSTNGIIVGEFGTGILTINSGGQLTTVNGGTIGDLSGSNGTVVVDGAGSKWTNSSGGIGVGIGGAGSVTITNGGQISGVSASIAGNGATAAVLIDGANSKWTNTGSFGVGFSNATSTITVSNGGLLSDNNGTLGGGSNSTTHMTVTGTGSAWTNAGSLSLNGSTNAITTLDILAGASLSDTTADVQKGAITVDGAGSTWTSSGNVKVGSSASGSVVLTNGGVMSVGGGSGVLNLGFGSSSNGTLGIGGIAGATNPGTLQAGSIVIGANNGGQGTVIFSHASGNYNFAIPMSGPGQVKFEHGLTNLSGTHTYTGATTVELGATLNLLGSLGNTSVTVQNAGFLQGTGSIAGNVTVSNLGRIVGVGGQTLTMGGLTLTTDAIIPVTLGSATATPVFQVNGALTLDGSLQITNAGAFGPGVYRLFNYTGSLTDNTLDITSIPAGVLLANLSIQTGTAGQVNLAYAGAGLTQYWNGAVTSPNGSVNGGAGTWNTSTTNWTNGGGNAVAAWGNGFGIFTTTGGAVTIAAGGVSADGAQFAVNGYTVGGGTLTLTNSSPTLRVGDGTAGGAAMTATINSVIAGSNGLIKTDLGTLVLGGTNTYTGGTTVNGGVLQIGSDANLGAAAGAVTLNGGTLKLTPGAFAMGRTLTVQAGGGALDLAPGATLDLNGQLLGSGALSRDNSGLLRIQGGGAYSGTLTNNAGILAIGSNLPNANIVVASGASLQGNSAVGGAVHILNGGEIDGFNGQLFTVGSLVLDPNAKVFMRLGAPSLSPLIQVNGALTLDGTLTIGSVAGYGPGLYRLFNYTGALTDNGLAIGTVPAGTNLSDLSIQTSVGGQVNLVYSAGPIQFWNGSHTTANGTVNGGTGTWKIGTTNWTDTAGANAGTWANGQIAIFAGAAGTVTVDNSGGAVAPTALQFATNGYVLSGGPLTLNAPATVRVGDGTAAGSGMTATVNAQIVGASGLAKTDLGTLVLTGANTFAGGVDVQGGTLSVSADNNLGQAGATVTLSGGKLAVTNSFATTRNLNVTALSGLDIATSKILTLNGNLNGSGNLIQSGQGIVVFNGAGSYSGGWGLTGGAGLVVNGTLSAGGVAVSPGGYLGGTGTILGAVTMSDGSHLAGAAGQTLTMGPLLLTNATEVDVSLGAPSNTALFSVHSGLTLDGHLNVTDAGGFGLGVYRLFDYTGALTNNGMTLGTIPAGSAGHLSIQTSVASQVNLVYSALAPIQFWNGSTTSPDGTVHGGAGTWRLGDTNWTDAGGSSAQTWGGQDAVFMGTAGAVVIDNSGGQVSANSIQFASNGYSVTGGPLLLTGGPTVIRVGDGTAAGASFNAVVVAALNGSGGVAKTDLGILTLSGVNGFTGGLDIQGGQVVVNADAALGAAAGGVSLNGGSLSATGSFSSGRTVTVGSGGGVNTSSGVILDLAGHLAGSGVVTKGGAGTLIISGNSSGFAGTVGVSGGALQVDGTLGGTVFVSSGGRLKGHGQVGLTQVAAGGILSPGNSIGTITVAGDLTLAGGSIYEVELNPAGQSDLTHATGAATINASAIMTAQPAAGTNYALGTRYTVITADAGRTGTFGTFNGSALSQPFLKLAPAYDATHVYIDVVRNSATFCSVTVTANQCAAAGGAESLGQGNAVYNAVANLPDAASANAAFDLLSGEAYASARGVMTEDSRFVRDATSQRLLQGGEGSAGWGQVFGADGHWDGDGNAARAQRSVGGFLLGGDWQAGEGTRLGVLAGYSRDSFKVGDRRSSGDIESYHLGAYGGHQAGAWRVTFGAAYAWHDLSLDRQSAFGGTPSASARANTGQVFGEAGYRFGGEASGLTPFVALAAVSTHADGFTEGGGATALKGQSGSTASTFATVGLRGDWTHAGEGGNDSIFRGVLAWRSASGDKTPDARLAFASGGSAFTVTGAPIGDSVLVMGADLSVGIGARARAGFTYDGQFGDGVQDQSVKASLKIAF